MILNTTALPYSWHFVNSRRTTGECQTINSHPKSINYLFVLDNSEGIEGSNANLWLWERHMGSLWTAVPKKKPRLEQGHSVGRSSGDEVSWSDHKPPSPISLCSWEGGGRIGREAEPGKKVVLIFISRCFTPVRTCSKWNYLFPSWGCFSHGSNWWVVSVLIATQKLSLCVKRRQNERATWWAPAAIQG